MSGTDEIIGHLPFQAPGKAERTNALEDVKQACGVIEHSNVNHIR